MCFESLFPYSKEFICNKSRELKQKPVHLGIIAEGIDASSFQDVMNLIKWSYAASINDITLYDPQGY